MLLCTVYYHRDITTCHILITASVFCNLGADFQMAEYCGKKLLLNTPTTARRLPIFLDAVIHFQKFFGRRHSINLDAGIQINWTPASNYFGCRRPNKSEAGIQLFWMPASKIIGCRRP